MLSLVTRYYSSHQFLGNTTIRFRMGNSELTQLSGNHQSHFGNDVKVEIIIILFFLFLYKTIVIIKTAVSL